MFSAQLRTNETLRLETQSLSRQLSEERRTYRFAKSELATLQYRCKNKPSFALERYDFEKEEKVYQRTISRIKFLLKQKHAALLSEQFIYQVTQCKLLEIEDKSFRLESKVKARRKADSNFEGLKAAYVFLQRRFEGVQEGNRELKEEVRLLQRESLHLKRGLGAMERAIHL